MGLILTRKPGESIDIGDDVVVTVLSIDRNRVHIGIEAPRELAVNRREITRRIDREHEADGNVT